MPQLPELQKRLYDEIVKDSTLGNAQYAQKCATSVQAIKNSLGRLKEKGYIFIASKKPGTKRDKIDILKEWPKVQIEDNNTDIELVRAKVSADIEKRKDNAKLRELEAKYKHLLNEYELSEKRFDELINIKDPVDINYIEPVLSKDKNEAIPIIQLSDWHFEEKVDPITINDLNEYDLEIAKYRWTKCVQNSLKLVHKERNSSDISQVLLWLGGDFISGYIHEELMEGNLLSPTQAVRFAKERIITAIKFYLEHGKFQRINIVCNYGNHGRTTQKTRISSGYKNSYEWMLYHDIADYFSAEKRVNFQIANGIFNYANVLGYNCRFFHGDSIKYGGGIGGLTVPLIKAIQRYNQQTLAQYNFMGHFHTLFQATKDCIVNGSGIGYNAYAQSIGASPEEPMQSFSMIDAKYGMTIKTPIFCK